MTTNDPDIILSEPVPLTLSNGLEIEVERLRTRALMSLLKILTYGAGEALLNLRVTDDTSEEDFTGALLGAIIFAIPEAENETIEFINRMVVPAGLRATKTKEDIAHNVALDAQLRDALSDPDLTDLFLIVSEIVKREAPHIRALGKQISVLFPMAKMNAEKQQTSSTKRSTKKSTQTD